MGTIRSQMVLTDGVSAVLRKITSTLDMTLASFENVQRAAGEAIDVSAIEAARVELADAGSAAEELASGYRLAAQEENRLNDGIRRGTSAADGMLGKVKSLVAALGAAAGVSRLVKLSDSVTSTRARLDFLVEDGGSVEALEQKIMASAKRSRAYYLDTAASIASMGANAGAAFSGNDELIAFMEQVNKQFVIGGASAQGQSAAMLQLTQAMAAGALRGEELNSILENAPGIARTIESYMGAAEGSIKKYAEQGLITSEVVKDALLSAADTTNARFESMPMTWSQVWTGMKNDALGAFDPILTKINQIANSERFEAVANGLISSLGGVAAAAGTVLDLMISGGALVVDNWSWLEPIVWGLVTAFVAYNAVSLITSGISGAMAVTEGVKAAALALSTGATFTATAAQYGFNAALLASPVTWVVAGVIALVAGIMALCGWIANTTNMAQTGFGVLTGGISTVVQAVVNAGRMAANILLGVWNAAGAVCSNMGTAFHNVIVSIQSWFYGLLSTALTVVGGICESLNKLPFVEFDYSGITGKADEYAARAAEAAGNTKSYTSVSDAFSMGFGTFDAFSEGWASDAFQAGAAWGDGVSDKVSGLFNSFRYEPETGAEPFILDGLGNDVRAIANNTGAALDALELSGEELKYLRDIAERDAINRFTTAEIKLDFSGMTNRIDSNMDLDGVIRELTDGIVEAVAVGAEGVHE